MAKTTMPRGLMPKWLKSLLKYRLFDVEIKFYFAFLLVIITGFWMVSTGLFSLKNDEIIYFLPYRYNIVENLRSGHLPLWSPYIYMGFPIAGDMQSGAWNPLVWLVALTGRYNLSSLHIELLVYVYFAALGMFKLMRVLHFNSIVCFTIAVSYIFSGFIIDSGQFMCWVSSACFLPYTYLYFIRLLGGPNRVTSAKFALANCGLLIVAGYPFFFIANIYFFFIGFLFYAVINWRSNERSKVINTFKELCLSIGLLTLLSAAPLLSFINLLPFYSRGTNMPLEAALFNSYSLSSSISFLFPFSVTRDYPGFSNNNVLSRNLYVGIILLPFIIKGFFTRKTPAWNLIALLILFSFAMSLGELLPFRKWAYWYLPLMNTFRHPSNFRLFITVSLLCFAGKGLQDFLSFPKENRQTILKLFYFVLLITLITGMLFFPYNEANPFQKISFSPVGLKKILSLLSFRQGVFLSMLVQLPFLILAIFLFSKKRYYLLCILSLVNMVVLAQPQLFSSTVSKNSVARINKFIQSQPPGFPIPSLKDAIGLPNEKKEFIYDYKDPIKYFFNKKIAINTYINNPTILKTYGSFTNDSPLIARLKMLPVIFLADSTGIIQNQSLNKTAQSWLPSALIGKSENEINDVSIVSFQPNQFMLLIKTSSQKNLVIQQNNFPGWKATTGSTPIPIETVNDSFMGLKIPAGSCLLNIRYEPGWFIPGMIVSAIGLLLILVFLFQKPSFNLSKKINEVY